MGKGARKTSSRNRSGEDKERAANLGPVEAYRVPADFRALNVGLESPLVARPRYGCDPSLIGRNASTRN